jgi:hypothetical protein
VLSYLFLASRVPYDDKAISHIIARDDKKWVESFRPQYPRPLSWWITIRRDLTQWNGILAVSIEDMILQMRYLLYLIGCLSSSLFYSEWESSSHPSRPFGKILYDTIREMPQLMESKADLTVAFEMIHVREWERLHKEGLTGEWSLSCSLGRSHGVSHHIQKRVLHA